MGHFSSFILFAGDFNQLPPVGAQKLCDRIKQDLFQHAIHTMLELKTNHRFHDDVRWGLRLERVFEHGPNEEDTAAINSRIVKFENSIPQVQTPFPLAYAVDSNKDRCAINTGIFAFHLKTYHSKQKNDKVPFFTICVRASQLEYVRI